MNAATTLAPKVGVAPACRALGVPRATFYRRRKPATGRQQPNTPPARALSAAEREQVRETLASPRFVDRAPAEAVATLLDEGPYLCSERTMYRILAEDHPVRERRNQLAHPHYARPELVATAPNQTWSRDITRLLRPTTWTCFHLYVLLDIFSRYVVGWMIADRENSALASQLIRESCARQDIQPSTLTLHSDRGSPMTSKCTAQLLADLGITRSLGRPPGQRRPPLLRNPLQDRRVPPRVPPALSGNPRRPALLPLLKRRTPPRRHRQSPPRTHAACPRPPAGEPSRRHGAATPNASFAEPPNHTPSRPPSTSTHPTRNQTQTLLDKP